MANTRLFVCEDVTLGDDIYKRNSDRRRNLLILQFAEN